MIRWDESLDTTPEVDGLHLRLYQEIGRLEPTLTESVGEAAVMRSLHLLFGAVERHFAVEEHWASVGAPAEACRRLKADHGRLLAMLWKMAEVPASETARRRHLFHLFESALERHDRRFDGPLFSVALH